jgi:hypothetical protein
MVACDHRNAQACDPYLTVVGQIAHRCAFGVRLGHLAALARIKGITPAKLGAQGHGSLYALLATLPD